MDASLIEQQLDKFNVWEEGAEYVHMKKVKVEQFPDLLVILRKITVKRVFLTLQLISIRMVIVLCYVNMCAYARGPWINIRPRYEKMHCWMRLKCSKKEAIFNIEYIGKSLILNILENVLKS